MVLRFVKNFPGGLIAVFCLILALLSSPGAAYGYADPGSGAFLYQAAYAAFLGGSFYLRRFLSRLKKRR
jgi:hypothetical protein